MGDSVVHNEHVSISILVFIIVFITDEINMISKQAHTQDLHIGVSHTNRSNRDLCSKMQVSHVKIIACSMLQRSRA